MEFYHKKIQNKKGATDIAVTPHTMKHYFYESKLLFFGLHYIFKINYLQIHDKINKRIFVKQIKPIRLF